MTQSKVEYWVQGRFDKESNWTRIYVDDEPSGRFCSLDEARVGFAEFLTGDRHSRLNYVRLTRCTINHQVLCAEQNIRGVSPGTKRFLNQNVLHQASNV